MIIQHHTGKAELCFVKVPENAKTIDIAFNSNQSWLRYTVEFAAYHKHLCNIDLPPGNWQIVGDPFELLEEQWKEVVPCELIGGIGGIGMQWHYPDYERSNCIGFDEATTSGASLLRSLRIYQFNPFGTERDIRAIPAAGSPEWLKAVEDWREAEKRKGPFIMLRALN